MGCCADLRTRTGERTTRRAGSAASVDGPRPPDAGRGRARMARARHLGGSAVLVYGPATGHLYRFADAQDVQTVYEADLPHLLRTGLFEALGRPRGSIPAPADR